MNGEGDAEEGWREGDDRFWSIAVLWEWEKHLDRLERFLNLQGDLGLGC